MEGGSGNDKLYGGEGNDVLYGDSPDTQSFVGHRPTPHGHRSRPVQHQNFGNDWLEGGAGNDRLYGGGGFDNLWGGSHSDVFVLDDAYRGAGHAVIKDFSAHELDKIEWGSGSHYSLQQNGSNVFITYRGTHDLAAIVENTTSAGLEDNIVTA